MKNCLLILLCYAVGLGVSYADPLSGCDFEDQNLRQGLTPRYGLDDEGGDTGDTYWFYEGPAGNTNQCVIRTYGDAEAYYDGYDDTDNPRPYWHVDPNQNRGLLEVDTPLKGAILRSICPVTSAGGPTAYKSFTASGLYFDGLVRLYCMDRVADDLTTLQAAGDKLECWVGVNASGATNLVITAGSVEADGGLTPVNFHTTTPVESGSWHRLTVRMVSNVATRGDREYVGFTVWLDGVQVVCDAADYPIGGGASRFEGNGDYASNALFPSMQTSSVSGKGKRLYAVGARGRFQMDEVFFTEENPFARPADEVETVIVCEDADIASMKLIVVRDSAAITNELAGAFNGTVITNYPNDKLTIEAVAANGRELGTKLKVAGNPSVAKLENKSPYNRVRYAETFTDGSRVTVTIPTIGTYFAFEGRSYSTFSRIVDEVLDRGEGGVVELVDDLELDPDAAADNGQLWVKPAVELRLDLKGRKIKGTHYREEAAVYAQGRFTVFDSVGGGSIEAPGTAVEVVDNDALEVNHELARMQLGDEEGADFSVKGIVKCTLGELVLKGGAYTNPGGVTVPPEEFYLKDYVCDDGRFEYEAAYVGSIPGFRVFNDGGLLVANFRLDPENGHGTIVPTNRFVVAPGATVGSGVTVDAPGYTLVKWLNGTEDFDPLTTAVNSNVTLTAVQTLDHSTITYRDGGVELTLEPNEYTVEAEKTALPVPEKPRQVFLGWRDQTSGHIVVEVGAGAVYADTNLVVCGNLVLEAQWAPAEYIWTNADPEAMESNGVYSGSFELKVPNTGALATAAQVKITEIAFSVVNPVTLPKTAPYLAVVREGETVPVLSEVWDYTQYLGADDEYLVGEADRLSDRRAKVVYRFSDLKLVPGKVNTLYFASDTSGTQTAGFLRLVKADDGDWVIGNCEAGSSAEASEDYENFRPVYEVKGEAVD